MADQQEPEQGRPGPPGDQESASVPPSTPESGGPLFGRDPPKQPIIVLLTSHWIAMAGVALVTLAGFSWLFVLPENIRGNVGNPYIGLLVFMAIPAVFFAGLALIPIGIALGRRKAAAGFGGAARPHAPPGAAPVYFSRS